MEQPLVAHLEADVVHTTRLVSLEKSGDGAVLAIRVQQLQKEAPG